MAVGGFHDAVVVPIALGHVGEGSELSLVSVDELLIRVSLKDSVEEGYDLAARLADLRAAAALVDDLAQEGGEERVFDTLGTVEAVRRACLAAMRSWGSRSCRNRCGRWRRSASATRRPR